MGKCKPKRSKTAYKKSRGESNYLNEKKNEKILLNSSEAHKKLGIEQNTAKFLDLERLRKRLLRTASTANEPLNKGAYNRWKRRPNTVGTALFEYFTRVHTVKTIANAKQPMVSVYHEAAAVPRSTFDNLLAAVEHLAEKSTQDFPWSEETFKTFVKGFISRSFDLPKKAKGEHIHSYSNSFHLCQITCATSSQCITCLQSV